MERQSKSDLPATLAITSLTLSSPPTESGRSPIMDTTIRFMSLFGQTGSITITMVETVNGVIGLMIVLADIIMARWSSGIAFLGTTKKKEC